MAHDNVIEQIVYKLPKSVTIYIYMHVFREPHTILLLTFYQYFPRQLSDMMAPRRGRR